MKELKITTGEPFRAKVLGYSFTDFNKVVQRNSTLYSVNDNVFLCEERKDERGHKDNDLFVFVLKVEALYVETESYSRSYLDRHPDIVEGTSEIALKFIASIHKLVEEKKHVQLLHIRVFEELGLDTKPLWAVREERAKLKEADKEKKNEERKEREIEGARQEAGRLEKVKQQFLNDEYIDREDFLILCKNDKINIPIQTIGTFNKNVNQVRISGWINYTYSGKRSPKLDGCHKAIEQYKSFLNSNP